MVAGAVPHEARPFIFSCSDCSGPWAFWHRRYILRPRNWPLSWRLDHNGVLSAGRRRSGSRNLLDLTVDGAKHDLRHQALANRAPLRNGRKPA